MRGSVAAAVLGIIVGGLALVMAGPPAYGLYVPPPGMPPSFNPVTPQELTYAKHIFDATTSADATKSAQAKEIVRRNFFRTMPRMVGKVSARGSLIGVAAGVWTFVGLELLFLPCWDCGASSLDIDAQMRMDSDAMAVSMSGPGSGSTGGKTNGIVTWMGGSRDSSTNRVTLRMITQREVVTWQHQVSPPPEAWRAYTVSPSFRFPSCCPALTYSGTRFGDLNISGAGPPAYQKVEDQKVAFTGPVQTVYGRIQGSTMKEKQICVAGSCTSGPTDTVEIGQINRSPGTSPEVTTEEEGTAFINALVADPQAPEVLPEEDQPIQEPDPNWDPDTDPFSPIYDPFKDPEGDPDDDGIPNRVDPDPEGDEDADGDGDPNEHPPLTPWPEPNDPEEDGDPDGDGSPNETNPPPEYDPYDPEQNPDGDPDEDGIPNHADPDPVNPTDPETLPEEHPYADPDEDGVPNKDDEDDDGDGIPDEEDPEPYVPTDPSTLPDEHPYADPDEDGVPNKDDGDDDGDGIPDETDPTPTDPDPDNLPRRHPFADPDEDGTPNRQDKDDDNDGGEDWKDGAPWYDEDPPFDDPGQPDEDDDGVPTWEDPWPGNPYAPSRPGLDEDLDDVPDYQDPVPDDPGVPWRETSTPEDPADPTDDPGTPTIPSSPSVPETPKWPEDPTTPVTPTNPKYPTHPTWRPTEPTNDPTNPTAPSTPVEPSVPDDPTVPGSPDPPPTTEPPGPSTCESPRQPVFVVPRLNIGSVFPFSLVVYAWNMLGGLVGEPVAPVIDMGFLGVMDLGEGVFGTIAATARTAIWIVAGIGMLLVFYTWIRSGSS